jgi:ankyrin repeat protein
MRRYQTLLTLSLIVAALLQLAQGGPSEATKDLLDIVKSDTKKVDVDRVRELLEEGGDPNVEDEAGVTPLIQASGLGQRDLVRLLLENGAKIDHQDQGGVSSLLLAAEGGHIKIVRLLLESGANPNLQDSDGMFALLQLSSRPHPFTHPESEFNMIEAVKEMTFMLDKGADPNLRTSNGGTVLMALASSAKCPLLSLLLQRGANVMYKNRAGLTALHLAVHGFKQSPNPEDYSKCVKYLQDAVKKTDEYKRRKAEM